MKDKIFSLFVFIVGISFFLANCNGKKEMHLLKNEAYAQIKKTKGIMELEAIINFKLDSDGSRVIVLSITNNTSDILWVPKASLTKNLVGCESINWFEVTEAMGDLETLIRHEDYGLCQFPRSYSKLLPNSSTEYILDTKYGNENQFKVEIWAPWRLKNGQLVDAATKEEALGKGSALIERIVGKWFLNP